MKRNDQRQTTELTIATAEGKFVARYSEKGLAALKFPSKQNHRTNLDPRRFPPAIRRWQRITAAALQRALAGRAPKSLAPLDLSNGTEFQQRVWNALRKIRCGSTQSYGQIASSLGKPKAVRAVGRACGANPIPVLIPCHRVLAANRKIGGFSGGLEWKRRLLAREGLVLG